MTVSRADLEAALAHDAAAVHALRPAVSSDGPLGAGGAAGPVGPDGSVGAGEGARGTLGTRPAVDLIPRLMDFAELLAKWNARVRLVGPGRLDVLVREQLVDALGFVPVLSDLPDQDFYDIGAGGGLPGLVLALAFPDRRFTLVEPIHKKTAFLSHAAAHLGLANVRVHTGRVEPDGRLSPPLRPAASARAAGAAAASWPTPTATFSRATLAPAPWLATARALLGPGGCVLIAVASDEALPAEVRDDPRSTALGRWAWTVPATAAPRLVVARRFL